MGESSKRRIRRAGSFWALPGWLLLLIEALDWAQRIDFVSRLLKESQVLEWLQAWGWLLGLAWLFILVFLWPERLYHQVHHARNAKRLQAKIIEVINRIERLRELGHGGDSTAADRLQTLVSSAVADLVEDVIAAVPEDVREEYRDAISYAVLASVEDEFGRGGPREWNACSGIRLYLERDRKYRTQTSSWWSRLLGRQ